MGVLKNPQLVHVHVAELEMPICDTKSLRKMNACLVCVAMVYNN